MKRFKKLSIMTTLAVFLLSLGATSAFAGWGWGDSMSTAQSLYYPGGGTSSSAYMPIEGPYDDDWYVISNIGGSERLGFSFLLTPPSGINYNLQLVKTDASGNILSTSTYNYSGPGGVEGGTTGINPDQKAYIRVFSQGPSDYDANRAYSLVFNKQ